MDTGKITTRIDQTQSILVAFGLKALGAIAVFVGGRWLINVTTITTPDNVKTIVGNGKIMGGDTNCHTNHYWQVYFDTNKAIADTLGAAGFPVATCPVQAYPV